MPHVSSIYDVMPFGEYDGVSLVVVFHQDIGYFRWCMEKTDDFCIQEWVYLKDVTTRNAKMFIPPQHKYEFGQEVYDNLQEHLSDEEILAFLGGNSQVHNPIFNSLNEKKLLRFGLEPQKPKLFDRTYISCFWFSYPHLGGTWEFEAFEQTSKSYAKINLNPTDDSKKPTNLISGKVGLIASLGPLATFKREKPLNNFPQDFFEPRELVNLETRPSPNQGEMYQISKLK